jgi:hypothetical protein
MAKALEEVEHYCWESRQNLKQKQKKMGKGGRMEETILPPF